MVRMIKSKREFVCSSCSSKAIVWSGICKQCGSIGTMDEKVLIAPKPRATQSQRAIIRRSKVSERDIGKRMLAADGIDPQFEHIQTSTGRVGHLTHLQFDTVSTNYRIENKNRRIPTWMIKAWVQILQISKTHGKEALLHLEPPNLPKTFVLNGETHKTDTIAMIRQDRHEDLIAMEKQVDAAKEILSGARSDKEILAALRVLFGKTKY